MSLIPNINQPSQRPDNFKKPEDFKWTPEKLAAAKAAKNNPTALNQASDAETKRLGQKDFLKLLVAQVQYQDPTNPKTDTSFIADMAQFTALEQGKDATAHMAALNETMASFIRLSKFDAAQSYLGKNVAVISPDGTNTKTGTVEAIEKDFSGSPAVRVNGNLYSLDQILRTQTDHFKPLENTDAPLASI